MSEDLMYSMLHKMMMKKFNLKANSQINISFNLSSFDYTIDITDDTEIAQEEEAGIQSTQEEFKFMAVADASEETKRVKANCILENNLQQASTSEKQYTELLEPISEPHQVPQNDSNVIFEVSSVEQYGGTVEQHPANVKETLVLYDSLYNNLAIKVERVNSETSTVSSFLEEKKRLKSDFKIHEDELLDKQIQLKNKIKELDNIMVKTAKFVRDFKSLAKEADESIAKQKALKLEIERLLRAVVSEQKDTTRGTSANTKFAKQSILEKPPSSSRPKMYVVTPLPKSMAFPKVGETMLCQIKSFQTWFLPLKN
nr:hypothetical protein [Tanacetum cinerariifolium]